MDAVIPARVWYDGSCWKALIEGEIHESNPNVFRFRVAYQGEAETTDMTMLCDGFFVQRNVTSDEIPDLLEKVRTSKWEVLPLCSYMGELLHVHYCPQEAPQLPPAPLPSATDLSAPLPLPPPLPPSALLQQQQWQHQELGQQQPVLQQPVQQHEPMAPMPPAQSSLQEGEASDYAAATSGRTERTVGTKRKQREDDVFDTAVRIRWCAWCTCPYVWSGRLSRRRVCCRVAILCEGCGAVAPRVRYQFSGHLRVGCGTTENWPSLLVGVVSIEVAIPVGVRYHKELATHACLGLRYRFEWPSVARDAVPRRIGQP